MTEDIVCEIKEAIELNRKKEERKQYSGQRTAGKGVQHPKDKVQVMINFNALCTGFKDEDFTINNLFYADDMLSLSQ